MSDNNSDDELISAAESMDNNSERNKDEVPPEGKFRDFDPKIINFLKL